MESREETGNYRIRIGVLVLLCCQNAGHALLTRYSQGVLRESYSSTEVVLVGEFMKLIVSGYLAITDNADTDAQGGGLRKLFWLIMNSRKIVALVFLYALSNLLSYYALARVDASAYTVLLQLKILTTAAFAVAILGRNISMTKWRALILLVIGCVLVASPAFNPPVICDTSAEEGDRRSLLSFDNFHRFLASGRKKLKKKQLAQQALNDSLMEREGLSPIPIFEVVLGFGAILLMNAISGFSSIYFESMLKKAGEKVTIWERNFQLAFYSIWLLVGIISYEIMDPDVEHLTFFRGWTVNTVLISIIQAGGGLLVAATLKYADSILKTLATSGSIVLSAILGHLLLGGYLDIFIILGCISTILAITNYTFSD